MEKHEYEKAQNPPEIGHVGPAGTDGTGTSRCSSDSEEQANALNPVADDYSLWAEPDESVQRPGLQETGHEMEP